METRDRSTGAASERPPDTLPRLYVDRARDGFVAVARDGRILDANPALCDMLGYGREELLGRSVSELFGPPARMRMILKRTVHEGSANATGPARRSDGTLVDTDTCIHYSKADGRFFAYVRDITETGRTMRQLEAIKQELQHERSLLQDKNVALQELTHQVEAEKRRLADTMQRNINRLVEPTLTMLAERCGESSRDLLATLRKRLADVVSPFVRSLELRHPSLSPRQVEVCAMIRNGLSSKEIARSLGISAQTVLTLRRTVRKKLGLTHGKTNLGAYLRSLDPPRAQRD